MATALYSNVGIYAAGLLYVVFGAVSVFGIYVTYCCGGGGQKEVDTGVSEYGSGSVGVHGDLDLKGVHSDLDLKSSTTSDTAMSDEIACGQETSSSFKYIV